MEETGHYLLGDLLESCRYSARVDWRESWAKGTALDDLLSRRVRRIEMKFTEYPAGRAEVTVLITATNPRESETFFYKFLRSAGQWHQISGV
jgi:hypothetical protein